MFSHSWSLTSITFPKIKNQKPIDMGYLFVDCSQLTSIDLSNFDTQYIEDMR